MSKYLVANFDRKEYLRPEQFGESSDLKAILDSYDGILTALVVLLSDGNGRGGGDLHSEHPIIGSWAGSRIALIDDAVTDAELSEPGMAHLTLQEQILSLGKDVSDVLVEVIGRAEENYSMLYFLNPLLNLSLAHQRELGESGLKLIRTPDARKKPLESMAAFFSILGVSSAWTTYTAKKRLQEGLLKTAESFGVTNRYEVRELSWTLGEMLSPTPYGSPRTVTAVTAITAVLKEDSAELPVHVEFRFGNQGDSPESVFQKVFPEVVFEKKPSLAESVASPEVAKLLSMIPNLEA
jgi:hypothetical protein